MARDSHAHSSPAHTNAYLEGGSATWRKNSNPIGTLQEICQQWKLTLPVYREAEGSYQEFGTEVTVILAGETLGFHALGRTKKVSKANAAQRVLE